jgi:methionyl-tRNA formyltransferase
LRTVFLGTSQFAAAILSSLADTEHRPGLVITRPDRPSGRGRKLSAPPVAQIARDLAIPLSQPERVNSEEARAQITQTQPQVVIVCAFGALITEPLLSEHPMLNVHPSLLARWRGAAPIERAIMAGDERTGVSIMRLTAGLDSGPVCLASSEPITPTDTYGSLSERLERLGGELLKSALDQSPPFADQDESLVTYAEKIGPADRHLDPKRTAVELERTVRALTPHVGAKAELADGNSLGVSRATVYEGELPAGIESGVQAHDGRLLLVCAEGALELLQVHPPGGRTMDSDAYLRGHH